MVANDWNVSWYQRPKMSFQIVDRKMLKFYMKFSTSTKIVTIVHDDVMYGINDTIAEAVVVGIHPLMFADC